MQSFMDKVQGLLHGLGRGTRVTLTKRLDARAMTPYIYSKEGILPMPARIMQPAAARRIY